MTPESESKPKEKLDDDPTTGQSLPPPDKSAAYSYPSYPYNSYPYGAPPPPQPGCPVAAPPYYPYGGCSAPAPPPPSHRHGEAGCFSRFISFVLIFLLFLFIASLLLRLILNPYLPEVDVSSVAVSGFDLSAASHLFSASFDVILALTNPRTDASIHYDHVGVAVLYDEEVISYTPIPPFRQDRENTTTVEARMLTLAEHLNEDTVEGMESERSQAGGGGKMTFRIRMFAWVRFASIDEDWWSSRYAMNAHCDDVRIAFSGATFKVTGSLADPKPVSCLVTI